MIQLIVFLGNPGIEYEKTRHNIGWMIADSCSATQYVNWQNKFKGVYGQSSIQGQKFFFLKPEIYMNKSGESVQALAHFFKIKPENILVVHDDIELKFGQIEFKKGGGLGGHNGLRSIVNRMGTKDFFRFRLGVDRPKHGDVSSYVLGKFSEDERIVLPNYLEKASEALVYCLEKGIEAALKKYQRLIVV